MRGRRQESGRFSQTNTTLDMSQRIAISIGDVTGIGPEVTLKAVAEELSRDDAGYVLIGDRGYLERARTQLGLELRFGEFSEHDSNEREWRPEQRMQPKRQLHG
jgi:4-hydroxy-L-threonine phosphate dehydrogenase PdxA